ncbi:MAG TPA: tetratricopeptide repeat protein [Bryobacteraceae bacterium]|nr:tetratricopeptide repeat protein [Bryobacteraceae bacterium]
MNLITACRFTAACAKFRIATMLAAAFVFCTISLATDCATGLSDQEKITRFKQLDGEAESAMQQHRPAEAVRLYQDAVCLVPNSARGYYGLGVAEAAAGDFLKARESLRTADRMQPTTGMPLLMQVRVNFSLGDIDTLKSNLREVADRFPHDAQLHTTLARFLAERNLFVVALAEAMRARQDSSDWNSSVQLAVLENTIGAYEDAIRNALAVEQNPAIPQQVRGAAAGVAGLSYESLHQTQQAVQYLNEAIELDGSQDNSYLALADLFDQEQRYQDAVNVLKQARTRVPDSSTVQLALGADLIRAEHYKEGLALLRELLQQAPDTPEAYISIADAARKTGDAAQEVLALNELERHKPDYPMIHVLLARAMLNQQPPEYSKILDELSIAARNTPNDPDVYFLRGKIYVALGRYEQALPALQRSIELRPTEPSAYYQLARVYQKLGRTDLAKQQFERVKYLESANSK